MAQIYVAVLMITAIMALLSIPILYLWAWAAGPAVKYLGRKWEEGRQRASVDMTKRLDEAYQAGIRDGLRSEGISVSKHGLPVKDENTAPAALTPQYTITRRRIR